MSTKPRWISSPLIHQTSDEDLPERHLITLKKIACSVKYANLFAPAPHRSIYNQNFQAKLAGVYFDSLDESTRVAFAALKMRVGSSRNDRYKHNQRCSMRSAYA